MAAFLVWLVVVELLGLAALPLTLAALPRLADRGYGLAKLVGILLITYLNYLAGSLFGRGNNAALLAAGAVVLCAGGLVLLRPDRTTLPHWLRQRRAALLIEEALFIGLFVAWALVRAAHPGILSTEKPMDLALMTASHKATSFPPYDPWLAGTSINYYYGGYLAVGTLVTLTGVSATVGYNLALALLFALVGGAAYSVAYGLTRSVRWAALGPIFVLLIGNLNGLAQYLSKGGASFGFFTASRVVEPTQCVPIPSACTITEFPAFSFLLGDLHPHVIALPFAILAIGIALNLALAPAAGWNALARTDTLRVTTMLLAALSAGALYFMNSWDWPTYLLLIGASLLVPGLVSLDRRALGEGVGIAVGVLLLSYLLFVQFHHDFKPQYSSFGVHLHGSPLGDVFTMFGLFLIPVAAFIIGYLPRGARLVTAGTPATPAAAIAASGAAATDRGAARRGGQRAATAVLEREPDAEGDGRDRDDGDSSDDDNELPELPRLPLPSLGALGSRGPLLIVAALLLALVLGALAGLTTAGLLLPFAGAALYLATRQAYAGNRENAFALLLCVGGIGLVILCDVVFLKDLFCGPDASGTCTGGLYRMNTVFKFYYQAWTLLALGAAYGLYALAQKLRGGWRRFVAPSGAIVVAAAGGIYLLLALFSPGSDINSYTNPVANAAPTLDGAAYLSSYSGPPITITNAIPADAAAIRWINTHVAGHPTILEADQVVDGSGNLVPQDYWPYPGAANQELMMSRISTFTGLPTVLGWGGSHEGLWHGADIVNARFRDLQTLYTSTDPAAIGALLRQYHVGYIYLGQIEAYTYYNNNHERVTAALDRFKRFGAVVYNDAKGGVTIIHTALSS